jgi:hypothetical protein
MNKKCWIVLKKIALDAGLFFTVIFPLGVIVILHSVYLSGIDGAHMNSPADSAFVNEAHRMARNAVVCAAAAGAMAASGLWCWAIRLKRRA